MAFVGQLASALARAQRRGQEGAAERRELEANELAYQDSQLQRAMAQRMHQSQTESLNRYRQEQVELRRQEQEARQRQAEADAKAQGVAAQQRAREREEDRAWRERESQKDRDFRAQQGELSRALSAARIRGAGARSGDSDLRAARTENRQAETDYNAMLARRPRQSQYRDALTGMADAEGFEDARAGFVADSTEKAGAREDARRRLSLLEGIEEPEPATDNRAAAIRELEELKSELEEALAAQPGQKDAFLRQYKSEAERINARYGIRP